MVQGNKSSLTNTWSEIWDFHFKAQDNDIFNEQLALLSVFPADCDTEMLEKHSVLRLDLIIDR